MTDFDFDIAQLVSMLPGAASWGALLTIRDIIDYLNNAYQERSTVREQMARVAKECNAIESVLEAHDIAMTRYGVSMVHRLKNMAHGALGRSVKMYDYEINTIEKWLTSVGYTRTDEI